MARFFLETQQRRQWVSMHNSRTSAKWNAAITGTPADMTQCLLCNQPTDVWQLPYVWDTATFHFLQQAENWANLSWLQYSITIQIYLDRWVTNKQKRMEVGWCWCINNVWYQESKHNHSNGKPTALETGGGCMCTMSLKEEHFSNMTLDLVLTSLWLLSVGDLFYCEKLE